MLQNGAENSVYRRLWENSVKNPENRVPGIEGHRGGYERALREDFVYLGMFTGVAYFAYQGNKTYSCL